MKSKKENSTDMNGMLSKVDKGQLVNMRPVRDLIMDADPRVARSNKNRTIPRMEKLT